jgi:hypothetical protein
MDQKPIVLYLRISGSLDLRMKGMALDDIHDDLVRALGKDAVEYSTVTKYARMLAALSFPAERKPPLPKLQMWNVVLSMRQYSPLLLNFRFCFRFLFRLCASFRGGSVFRDPPSTGTGTGTGTGTSRNHFAPRCNIFNGSPTFDGGTEVNSGPDDNRTIAGPLSAKHAPVARHCHLGRVVDLFVQ